MKQTMMQYFEWYLPDDASLWRQVSENAEQLARTGISLVWLPPAYKGQAGKSDVGYGVYDHYDLGEFLSKGHVKTKYGTKDEYVQCVKDLQDHGVGVIADIVLNHMMGSDQPENIQAQNVNENNRNEVQSDLYGVKVWTKFNFPQRNGKYSGFEWDWQDFSATDYNANNNQNGILLFEGKHFSDHVSQERGNFDYIMGADIDFSVPEVVAELYKWGIWYTEISGVNGFRLDAVKSIDAEFFRGWLAKMHEYGNHPSFAVGEFWTTHTYELVEYLKNCGHCMALFDVPLHFHFQQASNDPDNYDLRTIFDDTISQLEPHYSCAFSDNHDTQPGQALESWVQEWFKPLAYAFLLLYKCQYPCVFYGDYYGIPSSNIQPTPNLDKMIWIRRNLLSDAIVDCNTDDSRMYCWYAPGKHPVVVLMSTADWKEHEIHDFSFANKRFADINCPDHVVECDGAGRGKFSCLGRNVSVYILEEDCQAMDEKLV